MKTNSIKRFEKDLKEQGYEFVVVKELRDFTRYNVSKDGFTLNNFESPNVMDKPSEAIKWLEKCFVMAKTIYEMENDINANDVR